MSSEYTRLPIEILNHVLSFMLIPDLHRLTKILPEEYLYPHFFKNVALWSLPVKGMSARVNGFSEWVYFDQYPRRWRDTPHDIPCVAIYVPNARVLDNVRRILKYVRHLQIRYKASSHSLVGSSFRSKLWKFAPHASTVVAKCLIVHPGPPLPSSVCFDTLKELTLRAPKNTLVVGPKAFPNLEYLNLKKTRLAVLDPMPKLIALCITDSYVSYHTVSLLGHVRSLQVLNYFAFPQTYIQSIESAEFENLEVDDISIETLPNLKIILFESCRMNSFEMSQNQFLEQCVFSLCLINKICIPSIPHLKTVHFENGTEANIGTIEPSDSLESLRLESTFNFLRMTIPFLPNLRQLLVSDTNLETDYNFPQLRMLGARCMNAGSAISFEKCPMLEDLDISSCGLLSMGFAAGLSHLKTLLVNGNNLSRCVDLSGFPNLKILDISHNPVYEIINSTHFKKLELADFSFTRIRSFDFLENATKWCDLRVHRVQLRLLRFVARMDVLTSFDARDNELTSLSGLECLESLNTLYLSKNRLSYVDEIFNLPKLTSLDLNQNLLSDREISEIERALHVTCPALLPIPLSFELDGNFEWPTTGTYNHEESARFTQIEVEMVGGGSVTFSYN